MKNLYIIILAICLTLSKATNLKAQHVSKTGTTAAAFLEIPVGASAIGMGCAYVSIASDATSLFWNPSGITAQSNYEASFSHTIWIAETNFDFVGLIIPLGEFGNIGFSFTSLSMDDMKVRTVEQPEGTGEYFSAGDISVGFSYARNLTDRFAIGFTGKYIQQKIWHMSATAFALDAGTKFKTDLFGGMIIGAAIYNFGASLQMNGRDGRYFIQVDPTKQGSNDQIPTNIEMDSWDLPLTFQIGISTNVLKNDIYRFTVSADAIHPNNDYESMNFGFETSFREMIFIRGGYNSAFNSYSEGGLSLGFGLNSKLILAGAYFKFDYAYRDFGRLQNIHTFSINLVF